MKHVMARALDYVTLSKRAKAFQAQKNVDFSTKKRLEAIATN